jgi:hypothetical protein
MRESAAARGTVTTEFTLGSMRVRVRVPNPII